MLSTTQNLADEFTYGVLAHEFQHMIQFASDRNEDSWIDEGFAEVGYFLNGYEMDAKPWLYTSDPDLQLTAWDPDNSQPHYGQSFLYLSYFLDRFGRRQPRLVKKS
jgi:immune inhibitor A